MILRKLAPDDRLVGTARLAEKHNIEPAGLAWGIAAALAYDHADDAQSVELQARLFKQGMATVLWDVCRIQDAEPLAALVRDRYCKYDELGKERNER